MGAKDVFINPQFCHSKDILTTNNVQNTNESSLLNGSNSMATAVSIMKTHHQTSGGAVASGPVENKTIMTETLANKVTSNDKDTTTDPSESNNNNKCVKEIKSGINICTTMPATQTMGNKSSSSDIDEEWHQKYAFIIGLLRKPHSLLVKESLIREREKLFEKLNAYRLERNLVRDNIKKHIQKG